MNHKIHICHITTVHPRNDTRIFLKECKSLAAMGFEVHLIVGDGLGNSVVDGVTVHDIGPKPHSRIKRMWAQPKKAMKEILALQPNIVHFHDPELLPIGVKLLEKGMPVIYDAHEDVPRQHLTRHYIPKLIRPAFAHFFEIYENQAVKKLSGIVAATPHIERRFSNQGLKTVNINNYPMPTELAPVGSARCYTQVCYIGGISRERGALQVIQALPLVPDVRLVLCGKVSPAGLEAELRAEPGWSQVDYLGFVDRATVRRVMAESSAGLVTFLPAPNHIDAQPNKLFEYMSAELPVIASDFPLWRKIIADADCGICVDPDSPEKIADGIKELIESPDKVKQMGRSGRQAVLNKYNWPTEAQKLIGFYKAFL